MNAILCVLFFGLVLLMRVDTFKLSGAENPGLQGGVDDKGSDDFRFGTDRIDRNKRDMTSWNNDEIIQHDDANGQLIRESIEMYRSLIEDIDTLDEAGQHAIVGEFRERYSAILTNLETFYESLVSGDQLGQFPPALHTNAPFRSEDSRFGTDRIDRNKRDMTSWNNDEIIQYDDANGQLIRDSIEMYRSAIEHLDTLYEPGQHAHLGEIREIYSAYLANLETFYESLVNGGQIGQVPDLHTNAPFRLYYTDRFGRKKRDIPSVNILKNNGHIQDGRLTPEYYRQRVRDSIEMLSSYLTHLDTDGGIPNQAEKREHLSSLLRELETVGEQLENIDDVDQLRPLQPMLDRFYVYLFGVNGHQKVSSAKETSPDIS